LSPWNDWQVCGAIRRELRATPPHILHTHATKAGLVGRWAARGVPQVRTVHSPHAFFIEEFRDPWRRALGAWLERALARITDRYGLDTEALDQFLPRSAARSVLGIPASSKAVGVLGRLAWQKGQDWLLRAAADLCGAGLDLQLVLVGTGPDESRLRRLAEELGISGRVAWQGYVRQASRLLRAFDAVVVPSHYEGLSYSLLEALAAGVPLVASDIPANFPHPGVREIAVPVPVGDVGGLASALRRVLLNWDGKALRLKAGPELVRQHFRLDEQVAQLIDVYHELTAGAAGDRR
jgi:glycosyltransferase involved in cell wall biosynthesis